MTCILSRSGVSTVIHSNDDPDHSCVNPKPDRNGEVARTACHGDEQRDLTRGSRFACVPRSSALGRLTVFRREAREYCRNAREPASNDTARIPAGATVEAHGGVTGTWWTAAPYLAVRRTRPPQSARPARDAFAARG